MEKTIEERAMAASKRFIERKDYTVLDSFDDYLVADEDGTLRFVFVRVAGSDLPSENITRSKAENIAAVYLATHDVDECAVSFDIVSIAVLKEDKALLRFHKDALEYPSYNL